MKRFLAVPLLAAILFALSGCVEDPPRIGSIEKIEYAFSFPIMYRNGVIKNRYPDVDLSEIKVLPVYTSEWDEIMGNEEMNAFFKEFDIIPGENDVYVNETNLGYFSYDVYMRFDSSDRAMNYTNAADPYPETLLNIGAPHYLEYTANYESGILSLSEDTANEISEHITEYISRHNGLFGDIDDVRITSASLWTYGDTYDIMLELECAGYGTAEDIILNYSGFLDNLKIDLLYSEEYCGWESITVERCTRDRFKEVGTYDIIPYDEVCRRFKEDKGINYSCCTHDDIADFDVYLIYIMDGGYIRPVYVSTSHGFADFDNALGSFAWTDAIEY